jgi:hypothetical protein
MDELAKRFAALAEQYGPKVVDAALSAARTEAYSQLAAAAMWGVLALAIAIGGRFIWSQGVKYDEDGLRVAACGMWGFAAFCSLFVIWTFIDPWTWTTISNPELWIAKKAFKL